MTKARYERSPLWRSVLGASVAYALFVCVPHLILIGLHYVVGTVNNFPVSVSDLSIHLITFLWNFRVPMILANVVAVSTVLLWRKPEQWSWKWLGVVSLAAVAAYFMVKSTFSLLSLWPFGSPDFVFLVPSLLAGALAASAFVCREHLVQRCAAGGKRK